jgi:glycosyltransferase involved in cell wall biosynthesis
MADPKTDRRSQNFRRFFEQQGRSVEILTVETRATSGPRRFWQHHRQLLRETRERSSNVVMACDLFSLGAAARMKRESRASLLIYDSREVYTELPTVAKRPLAKALWKRFEHNAIDEVDLMLVTGPHDVDGICRVHDGMPRSLLVRNLPWNSDFVADPDIHSRFGLSRELPTLVYVGGLQEGRGLRQMIRAMSGIDAQLLIVGDGILDSELHDLVHGLGFGDRVRFAGPLAPDDALQVTAACDVGVSLIEMLSESYALALPSKIFEYMMIGIPVVSTRLRQVEELLGDEPWIEFVDVNSAPSIERGFRLALEKAATGAFRAHEMELARANFHFEADAMRLANVLHETFRVESARVPA